METDQADWGPWRGGAIWSGSNNHIWSMYDNTRFVVTVHSLWSAWGMMLHLMIQKKDGSPVGSWDDKQRIKNELCGEALCAIEAYPPEKDVVNQAPKTHLWVLPKGFELPFGLRVVTGAE